ncbi:AraC family transcriptional regulator [uncultured Pelagibacterium sp.]|uniref:helix-turn-helix domain-containing protein n=1 Tax=uncultured Pelagibacterium sp. TaxID=1159875 RepID=UPI0030DA3E80|tara:strand:+ start:2249 stop:3094 length:846 start_codon:yes stop_codon:yes gene_type:complete
MSSKDPGVFQKPAETYDPRGRLDPTGFDRHVRFRTRLPCQPLRPFLDHLWVIRWDVSEQVYHSAEVMHRPYVDVFLSLDWSGVQGTFRGKRVYKAQGSGRIIGARFLPGAFRSFWSGELTNLQEQQLPLSELLDGMDRAAIEQLLANDDDDVMDRLEEQLLLKKPAPDENIALVNAIIAAIEADEDLSTVSAVAGRFCYSERWLQQLFRTYVGIGLKWFLQRHRLLAAAERIRGRDVPDWAGMAYDLGYSSQQHFITDFRKVLGQTPLQYRAAVTRPPQAG